MANFSNVCADRDAVPRHIRFYRDDVMAMPAYGPYAKVQLKTAIKEQTVGKHARNRPKILLLKELCTIFAINNLSNTKHTVRHEHQ